MSVLFDKLQQKRKYIRLNTLKDITFGARVSPTDLAMKGLDEDHGISNHNKGSEGVQFNQLHDKQYHHYQLSPCHYLSWINHVMMTYKIE